MDAQLARTLEKALQDECRLYDEYLGLMIKEQSLVVKLESEAVMDLAAKRSRVAELIADANKRRQELVDQLEPKSKRRLTDVLTEKATPGEKKRLLPLVKKLRKSVEAVQAKAREFGQVVSFSLGMIDGSISVMSSAARSSSKAYGSDARVRENSTPKRSRSELVIKEA